MVLSTQYKPKKWILKKRLACASRSPGEASGSEEGRCSGSGRTGQSGARSQDARSDAGTAEGGAVQLGRGPCASGLLVDLGQQQGEGHGQGTVVEAVDVGVVPVLRGRNRTSLRPQPRLEACLPPPVPARPGPSALGLVRLGTCRGQRAPPQPPSSSLGVWPSVPSKRLPDTVQPMLVLPSTPRPPKVCADSLGLCRWGGVGLLPPSPCLPPLPSP